MLTAVEKGDPGLGWLWEEVSWLVDDRRENPYSWGMTGYAHSTGDGDAGPWDCSALFLPGDARRMDIEMFESLMSLSGRPVTVFREGSWRFYWRMAPDEIERLFLAAAIMEA